MCFEKGIFSEKMFLKRILRFSFKKRPVASPQFLNAFDEHIREAVHTAPCVDVSSAVRLVDDVAHVARQQRRELIAVCPSFREQSARASENSRTWHASSCTTVRSSSSEFATSARKAHLCDKVSAVMISVRPVIDPDSVTMVRKPAEAACNADRGDRFFVGSTIHTVISPTEMLNFTRKRNVCELRGAPLAAVFPGLHVLCTAKCVCTTLFHGASRLPIVTTLKAHIQTQERGPHSMAPSCGGFQ